MRCLGACIMNTTNRSSLGSTQKYVPPAPPQLYSPTEPCTLATPASRRTAKPRPKPKPAPGPLYLPGAGFGLDRKSTRLNSSHSQISYAVFCLKKKKKIRIYTQLKNVCHVS